MSQPRSIFLRPTPYYHTLYWILNVLFFTLIFWSRNGLTDFLDNLHENIAFLPMGMIFTYFSVNYLIPKYFLNNKIPAYIFFQIIVLLLYPVFSNAVVKIYISPVIHHTNESYGFYNGFLSIILILIFDIVPLAGVKILSQFRKEAMLRQKIDNDRLNALLKLKETELKLLKSQIHPHFLFNTLNNLYSLALEKSDKTPDLIIRLADMLSYIIYEGSYEKVPLTKEIEFIKSYIELQKVRYESCDITFKIDGEINGKLIAPMILHTFIDNSFKHGADKDTGNPWIRILLSIRNGSLFLNVVNSIREDSSSNGKTAGIGISNTMKRLDLLYLGRNELNIDKSENKYSVSLRLDL